MEISLELTLTPLQNIFEIPISAFIKALRTSGCAIKETPLSTQVYGKFSTVMLLINQCHASSFSQTDHVILNMKMVKSNRSDYEPNF